MHTLLNRSCLRALLSLSLLFSAMQAERPVSAELPPIQISHGIPLADQIKHITTNTALTCRLHSWIPRALHNPSYLFILKQIEQTNRNTLIICIFVQIKTNSNGFSSSFHSVQFRLVSYNPSWFRWPEWWLAQFQKTRVVVYLSECARVGTVQIKNLAERP